MRHMRAPLVTAFALAATASVQAEIRLPAAFTDHMVLQRDRPIRVFGSAQTHEEVTVEVRDPKGAVLRTGRTTADQSGHFAMVLDAAERAQEREIIPCERTHHEPELVDLPVDCGQLNVIRFPFLLFGKGSWRDIV
jgi:sialate O-acetylesterase